MIQYIEKPAIVEAAGTPPKRIEEFFGRVSSHSTEVSIARMVSPGGWTEPGQAPEFDEYTVVLKGVLSVRLKDREICVQAGQGILIPGGTWGRYSTLEADGAEYLSVCLSAFSPETVHRDL